MDDNSCDFCGTSVLDDIAVSAEVTLDNSLRVASGYFCSWEHAASWFATGESSKSFDIIFSEELTSLTRRERMWNVVEPVGAFVLFLWACGLILIGSWTVANWVFPFAE